MVTISTDQELLAALRSRRAQLRESMSGVEHALASPVRADFGMWKAGVRVALEDLARDFHEHIAITEGPDGLYRELAQKAPRLSGPVDRLVREHGQMERGIDDLLARLEGPESDFVEVREMGTDLLATLMRHRQRGADLVFEAYEADIGGET